MFMAEIRLSDEELHLWCEMNRNGELGRTDYGSLGGKNTIGDFSFKLVSKKDSDCLMMESPYTTTA